MNYIGSGKLYYDKLYSKNLNIWGEEPAKILVEAREILSKNNTFLDLGYGQGRNAF